jgi:metallo-beta-lactamase family protein
MEIQFLGAARTITGSMHRVKANGRQFLLDCGIYEGPRGEAHKRNMLVDFFDPAEIDFVILSHAHLDHSGNLPSLVKGGFRGHIFSTPATMDLTSVILANNAISLERDFEFLRKTGTGPEPAHEPLYRLKDIGDTLKRFVCINYHRKIQIAPGIQLEFYDAGHMLGSASTHLGIEENGNTFSLAFSGDIGKSDVPLLGEPEPVPDADYLVCEGTYGDTLHDSPDEREAKLRELLDTAIAKRSKVIVPSSGIGKTQELVYMLFRLFQADESRAVPIYLDSPFAANNTFLFKLHLECFNSEAADYLINNVNPLGFEDLHLVSSREDSMRLNTKRGPCIVITSSPMCESGRVLHHLAHNIENPDTIVLMVGMTAENTLGAKLVNRDPVVKIFGKQYQVRADVRVIRLSGHADARELSSFCGHFSRERMKSIFLVHGELAQLEPFRQRLVDSGFGRVTIPEDLSVHPMDGA